MNEENEKIFEDIRPGELFTVVQFFSNNDYEIVRKNVPFPEAMTATIHYCNSVGAKLNLTSEVRLIDQFDRCLFQWTTEEGVVFPEELKGTYFHGHAKETKETKA